MNRKRTIILISSLLIVGGAIYVSVRAVLSYACYPVGPSTTTCGYQEMDREAVLTVDQAAEKGFPIYLPSSQVIESLDLSFPPTITLKIYDSTCSYLEFLYYHREDSSVFARMLVSNGCAYPLPASMYSEEIKLEWAKNQTAFLAEGNEMFIVVKESKNSFQYLIFPEESIATTLEFLESMEHISD